MLNSKNIIIKKSLEKILKKFTNDAKKAIRCIVDFGFLITSNINLNKKELENDCSTLLSTNCYDDIIEWFFAKFL